METTNVTFDPLRHCRVCLQIQPNMCEVFGKEGHCEVLRECTGAEVEEGDGFPLLICDWCVGEMLQAHKFILKYRETDKKLRAWAVTIISRDDNDISTHLLKGEMVIKTEVDDMDFIFNKDDSNFSDCDDFLRKYPEDINDNNHINVPFVRKKRKYTKSKKYQRKKITKSLSQGYPKKCPHCPLVLKCESVMIMHLRIHSKERPYQCCVCGDRFGTKGTLKTHMAIHKKHSVELDFQYKFECDYCHKVFCRKQDIRTHIRIHTGETPYLCKHCGRRFKQSSSLIRHTKTHTGEKSYKCPICQKSFSMLDSMKKHSVVHMSERNYPCPACKKLFKTKSCLKAHINCVHDNKTIVVCDQCGMSFKSSASLRCHISTIHSELSGNCTICNKHFTNLKEHMRYHTGETPCQCSICDKKFCTKTGLRLHARVHDNSNKFSCEIEKCGKGFPCKFMLEFHILKYHKKYTPYICKHCSRAFYRLSDLRRHLKLNHSDVNFTMEHSNDNLQ